MKKITLIFSFLAIFGFLFIFNVPTIKAQTASQLQALIQQLQAQISALQQQLTQVQGQPTTWCHTFNANMAIGSSGTEVLELKTALIKNGVWPYEDVTDEFDEETASYVVAFQQKYRSEILIPWRLANGTGFVGSSTRSKLNSLYGCR